MDMSNTWGMYIGTLRDGFANNTQLKKRPEMRNMYQRYNVEKEDLRQIGLILDDSCQNVAEEIQERAKASRVKKSEQSTTPSKPILRASPTKPPRKLPSGASSPTKTPILKRVKSLQEGLANEANPKTPERKKAKTAEIYQAINTLERRLPSVTFPKTPKSGSNTGASSSRVTLDLQALASQPSDSEPPNISEEEAEAEAMLVDSQASTSTSAPSLPFTPQRPKRSTLFPKTPGEFDLTPKPRSRAQRRAAALMDGACTDEDDSEDEEEEDEDEEDTTQPRRHRPILLGHRQWLERDPRIERERAIAQDLKQKMVKKYGHPFAHLRSATLVS